MTAPAELAAIVRYAFDRVGLVETDSADAALDQLVARIEELEAALREIERVSSQHPSGLYVERDLARAALGDEKTA